MAEIDLEKTEKVINSVSNLIEKLEGLPIAIDIVYLQQFPLKPKKHKFSC